MKVWSLKAKTMIVSLGGLLVITGATSVFFRQLTQANMNREAASIVVREVGALETHFNQMAYRLHGFLVNPSSASDLENKEKAEQEAGRNWVRAKEASKDSAIDSLLDEIRKYDELTIHMVEKEFIGLIQKGDRTEAEHFYFNKYIPARQKLQSLIDQVHVLAENNEVLLEEALQNMMTFGGNALFSLTFLCLLFSFIFNQRIAGNVTKSIQSVAEQVGASARSIEIASKNTAATSEQMAASAAESAAAISETLHASEVGKSGLKQGKSVIIRMSEAMNGVYEANSRLEQLNRVIEDLQGKTKLINDIVFETKLLSFNASIEAARAGSHGKGFAVVAEEVGKLAVVSGKVAEEINSLLVSSSHQVRELVANTNQRVAAARETNTYCETVFSKMNQSIDEINRTMQDMEKETYQTSKSSEELARQAKDLALESNALNGKFRTLMGVIAGDSVQSKGEDLSQPRFSKEDKIVPLRSVQSEKTVAPHSLVEKEKFESQTESDFKAG